MTTLNDSKERFTEPNNYGRPTIDPGVEVPSNTVVSETTAGLAAAAGVATTYSRGDHTHGSPAAYVAPVFAGTTPGDVPTSSGGVVTFLRADGAWATPPSFGASTAGYATASGGGTINFLRADGTWAAPPGGGISSLTAGVIPVADAGTSLVDSRITQVATGYSLVLGPGLTTDAGLVLYGSTTLGSVLQAFDTVGGTYSSPLCLRGGGTSTAYVKIEGTTVEVSKSLVVNGWSRLAEFALTLTNGANVNLPVASLGTHVRVTGPTASFSIGGFDGGADGAELVVYNSTDQAMTIKNQDPATTAVNRIITHTDADLVLPVNTSVARFIYNATDARWVLASTSAAGQYLGAIGFVPYQSLGGYLTASTLYHNAALNTFGFAAAAPLTTVDVGGTTGVRSSAWALANGLNSNMAAPTTSFAVVTAPTAVFSLGGIVSGVGENGKTLVIFNYSGFTLTIKHENTSSTAANRIVCPGEVDLTVASFSSVELRYYGAGTNRWLVTAISRQPAVGADGYVQFASGGHLTSDEGFQLAGTGTGMYLQLGTDLILARKTATTLQLGPSLATVAARKITGQSTRGGTDSNLRGGKFSSGGGAGTGTGGGGDTSLVTALPGAFGSTQNAYIDRMVYASLPVPLTNTVATEVATVSGPDLTGSGGILYYTVYATDGTDAQTRRGSAAWAAVVKAGVATVELGGIVETKAVSAGTLAVAVTAVGVSGGVSLRLAATTSLTPTTLEAWISMSQDGRWTMTTIG